MTMPDTPIATNIDEALDVKVNLFSKLPLNPMLPVNKLPKTINLLFSKAIRLSIRINTSLSKNPLAQGRANAIDIL